VPELRKNVIGVRYWSQEGDMWPETMADLVWAIECADFYLFSEKEQRFRYELFVSRKMFFILIAFLCIKLYHIFRVQNESKCVENLW
jgi:hypothetical protein